MQPRLPDGKQVVKQRTRARRVLHEGAAAADIELGAAHEAAGFENVEGVDRVDERTLARLGGVAAQRVDGQVGVDVAELLDDGI